MEISAAKISKGKKVKWRPLVNGKKCNALDVDTRKRALEMAAMYAKFYAEEGINP